MIFALQEKSSELNAEQPIMDAACPYDAVGRGYWTDGLSMNSSAVICVFFLRQSAPTGRRNFGFQIRDLRFAILARRQKTEDRGRKTEDGGLGSRVLGLAVGSRRSSVGSDCKPKIHNPQSAIFLVLSPFTVSFFFLGCLNLLIWENHYLLRASDLFPEPVQRAPSWF